MGSDPDGLHPFMFATPINDVRHIWSEGESLSFRRVSMSKIFVIDDEQSMRNLLDTLLTQNVVTWSWWMVDGKASSLFAENIPMSSCSI